MLYALIYQGNILIVFNRFWNEQKIILRHNNDGQIKLT